MQNPWLKIPLSDYEAHMALPTVGQLELLAEAFAATLARRPSQSVALLGCAGGNGLDRIHPNSLKRVVGVDINPDYVSRVRERYGRIAPSLELFVGDLERDTFDFAPVDLVFAALIFEYVAAEPALDRIRAMLTMDGLLVVILQLPSSESGPVTASPYASLASLTPWMKLAPPEDFIRQAKESGFTLVGQETLQARGGKKFLMIEFSKMPGIYAPGISALTEDS
ncbi:MAG: class I SAM-dependent methyltransferase [Candidatus Zhuqueibacterota bacterium]